jgi:hypothetical protein
MNFIKVRKIIEKIYLKWMNYHDITKNNLKVQNKYKGNGLLD